MKRYSKLERVYHKSKELIFGLYWLILFKNKDKTARKARLNFSSTDLSRIETIEKYFADNVFEDAEIIRIQNHIKKRALPMCSHMILFMITTLDAYGC